MELTKSEFGGVTVAAPKGWVDNSIINFIGPPSDRFRANMVVLDRTAPGKPVLQSYGERQRAMIEQTELPKLELVASGIVPVDDRRLYHLAYTWESELEEGDPPVTAILRQDHYYEIKEQRVLTLTLSCLAEDFEKLEPTFLAIAKKTKLP